MLFNKLKEMKAVFIRVNPYFVGWMPLYSAFHGSEMNLKNEQKLGVQKSILYIYKKPH
jgi:hypothetical protein